MNSPDPLVACSICGKTEPRTEMFGAEPDLVCESCAQGIRKRMQVRTRPNTIISKPIVTLVCLGLCALIFLPALRFKPVPLSEWPAWFTALLQGAPIWTGQWWRHLTCIFVHFDVIHIGFNAMALWFLGRHIEGAWGHWVLAGLMVFTGIGASALQWWGAGKGIGISGAIFGLVGFLWALRKVHPLAAAIMNERMRKWILTMLVLGVILTQLKIMPIGNWAHGGGLAVGYLFGLAAKQPQRKLLVPAVGLLVVGLVLVAQFAPPLNEGMRLWRDAWLAANG